jgi:predicted Zn-dependent peptidase
MKFNRTVFSSGLRVITINMADNPTATVLVLVEAGSNYEIKTENGLSHFLEHLCFKGTTRRPKPIDLSRELDSIGSQYNAFTSQEFTGYYAKSNAKHLAKILDVVSDLYLNPTFPEAEIQKEKGVVIDEISMYEDLPHSDVHTLFAELLYGDQPAGLKITGTKESVRSFTREALIDYRSRHYVASATTIIVAGNFSNAVTESDLHAMIAEKFSGISVAKKHDKSKVVEVQDIPKLALKVRKTDQAHLVLGVRTFDIHDKQTVTTQVLSAILGGGMSSRLFQKLRDEMGVGYYVHSSVDAMTDHGYLAVSTGVDATRSEEVVAAIIAEFIRLKTTPVPEDELAKVKEYMIGNMYLGLESSDSIAEFYGFQELMRRKLLRPEQVADKIRAVTSMDIQDVARKIFIDRKLNLAAIGTFGVGAEERFLSLLKLN